MTAVAPAPHDAPAAAAEDADGGGRGRRLGACALLLLAYLLLSLVNDPDGYLGTDTGGKVLTLDAMVEEGSATDVDVGYWAERWDPEGDLHPYFGTTRVGDRWVQVTTLPLVLAARPLYDVGGYRAALLLPMLGGVACALAAAALARRLGADARGCRTAFWLVGLGGPVALYAVDLWEHTIGLAATAWAVVLLLDARRAGGLPGAAGRGLGAGLLVGAAFSMRTEALVYGAACVGAMALAVLVLDRRLVRAVSIGAAALLGVGLATFANGRLEAGVLGDGLRAERAGSAAGSAGGGVGTRLREALVTSVAPIGTTGGIILGLVGVVLLVLLVRRGRTGAPAGDRLPMLALVASAVLLAHALNGFHFVPGFLAAAPIAVAGAVLGHRGDARPVWWAALGALPVVWAFQYVGGAGAQWGGRYVLLSGLLLTVLGVVALPRLQPVVRTTVLVLSVAVTAFGVAWMGVRTHHVADSAQALAARPEPVLVAYGATEFVPREMVAGARERRWLMATSAEQLEQAAAVVDAAGEDGFGVVVYAGDPVPEEVAGFRAGGAEAVPYLPDLDLEVVTFSR